MSNNNSSNVNNNVSNGSNQDIYMAPLNDYEALYKIDLNFDADVSEMNDTVLSNYITRVIQGHPYYVSLDNVVDIIVDEDSNKITLIISNREVGDHIVNTTNNNVNEINALYNNIAPNTTNNAKLNLINAKYKDKKYILETTNEKGEPIMYEYEFKGFRNAKSLYHDESIELNGNRTRHFLTNDMGKTYFYDEYMNSQINFTPDERMNYLNRRISSLEDRLQHDGEEDPMYKNRIRKMVERASAAGEPMGNEVGINRTTMSNSRINNSMADNLLPSEMVSTTGVAMTSNVVNSTTSVVGVNNEILNNTTSVFQNGVITTSSLSEPVATQPILSTQSSEEPSGTTATSNLTFRALNNNAINNVNIEDNSITVSVNTNNMSNNDFENVTTHISNEIAANNNNKETTSVVAGANANNLGGVDVDNISEEDLDTELKNIINDIKNIEKAHESKNYNVVIGVILVILLIVLVGVVFYFLNNKNAYVGKNNNNSIIDTIKNNMPNFNKKNNL